MLVTHCCWNHNGSVLAVTGRTLHVEKSTDVVSKEVNAVKFYNMFGEVIRSLSATLVMVIRRISVAAHAESAGKLDFLRLMGGRLAKDRACSGCARIFRKHQAGLQVVLLQQYFGVHLSVEE